jgi:hypothetical protein
MAVNMTQLEALILGKTRHLVVTGDPGAGSAAARQFDAVLMCAGFKCSRDLLERLSQTEPGRVVDIAVAALPVIRELAGDHVRHNTYFKEFPANVPDTMEFWASCLREAVLSQRPESTALPTAQDLADLGRAGFVLNLLSLPSYGRYQHTFEEMLAAHDELIPAVGDRVTVLHLGSNAESEADALYLRLAGSAVPPVRRRHRGTAGAGGALHRPRAARRDPRPGEPGDHQRRPRPGERRAARHHGHRRAAAGLRTVWRGRESADGDPVPVASPQAARDPGGCA